MLLDTQGNAETNNDDDGQGTMSALYFGNSSGWGHGQGKGPWVMIPHFACCHTLSLHLRVSIVFEYLQRAPDLATG